MPDGIDFQTLIVLVVVVIGGLRKLLSGFAKGKNSSEGEFAPFSPPSYDSDPSGYPQERSKIPQRRSATLPQPQTMADLTQLLERQYNQTAKEVPPPIPVEERKKPAKPAKKVTPKILSHKVETKLNQSSRNQALALLKSRDSLKQAIILQEVLGKPKSSRESL